MFPKLFVLQISIHSWHRWKLEVNWANVFLYLWVIKAYFVGNWVQVVILAAMDQYRILILFSWALFCCFIFLLTLLLLLLFFCFGGNFYFILSLFLISVTFFFFFFWLAAFSTIDLTLYICLRVCTPLYHHGSP